MARLVVTGALGHIGSFVTRDLAQQFPGADIVMVDNLATQRFTSLFDLPKTACYRFIEADVTKAELEPIVRDADVVVHLAAMTDAAGSFDRAELLEANNYVGTTRVADACASAGVPIISLSSTSVYGTQNTVVSEDATADELKPQSPYATTKLKEEAYIQTLASTGAVRGVVFRFGTIFGTSPGMRFHTAVNKFCWQAVMGIPLTVWRTAYDQKRPYLDLHDAARALAFTIRSKLFDGRIYNVLTLNATVREIVDAIREVVPAVEVQFVDNKIMNQLSYEVSYDRIKAKGFEPTGDLRRGILETVGLLRQSNTP